MSGDLSTTRSALGLPAGSVRALLTVMVVGLICALMLIPPRDPEKPIAIPSYLLYLLFLVVGHYFASRGNTRGFSTAWHHQPLWLPRGCVRLLILASITATCFYRYTTDPEGLEAQWLASFESLRVAPMLPVVVLLSFFLGAVMRMLIGSQPPAFLQDIEAWVALIAVLLMGAATMIHLVINPSLSQDLNLPLWEEILAAVVAFYFGERS